MKLLTIAIDGPAASGKGTLAKKLAHHFGYAYVDTGAMYRALTLQAIRTNTDMHDEDALVALLQTMKLEPTVSGGIRINGIDVSNEIRTPEVNEYVSTLISIYPKVRESMVALQQQLGDRGGIIMDGRDIGSVVLPNADVKIFLIADVEARAKRRFKEYQQRGIDDSYESVLEVLKERDYADMNREADPLRQTADAIALDSTNLSIDEMFEAAIKIIDAKQKETY
ncbi:(d)CMP kinase [Culicoidibacter larvae]|uniref:Cytidylate kinase n=1 Tax=Culicoidibacter larvae TaxID=2579976 RepID=A0A5R8QBE2_9FIRM|nr:(d)CMP kinase [Culicoidibacter larvae]TLG72979.1 (d)CMP kinase [Culicoidibacter larvae]